MSSIVFQDKKILLAITGGIAAYKAAFLIRLLKKNGAQVKVILTESSLEFVTPLTLSTLSQNPVYYQFKSDENGSWNNHVEMALWADFMIIAPCTANTLSKMVNGTCDNLVMATYLSSKSEVYVAPAMDLDMYAHPSTQENLQKLKENGNFIIPAETGFLASGLEGKGRMSEPENIVSFIENHRKQNLPLLGKKVLITAGPTYELIDPVRFIGNFSSGKMGFALADVALSLGAEVVLVTGPTNQTCHPSVQRIDILTGEQMYNAVWEHYESSDVVIKSAAVADYKPLKQESQKIKKKNESLSLELTKTTDILASLGENKKHQFLVGFALETTDEENYAKGKLERKNLDAVVLNSMNDKEAGFGKDTNKISIFTKQGEKLEFPAKTKKEVAKDILAMVISKI